MDGERNSSMNTIINSDINDSCERNGEVATTQGRYESEPDDIENRCGWGSFKPDCCQLFRSPKWILAIFSIFFIVQSVITNGMLASILSSLERQFELSSTEVGFIFASYEIAAVVCIIPISYFCPTIHQPRCMGLGCVLYGIGCFIFAIPHYASPLYRPAALNASVDICIDESLLCEENAPKDGSSLYYVFILGQVCQGIGSAPMFMIGISYLDESLHPKTSPMYIGTLMSMGLVGSAIGFAAGGQLLNLFTDFDRMDTSGLAIEPGHPSWVGAWWPGYLICCILCIMDGILIMGFPRTMPGASMYRKEREDQRQRQSSTALSRNRVWQRHFHTIFTNPYFIFMCCAACFETMVIVGYGAFLAKYIEYEFKLTTATASIYAGICLVFGGGFGMMLGGFLVKKIDLTCRRVIKFCVVVTFIWLIPFITILWRCPAANVAGVYTPYNEGESLVLSISSACNRDCNCGTEYTPICDTLNGVEYFSACHAGCIDTNRTNCACIREANNTTGDSTDNRLVSGHCPVDCSAFLVIFLLSLVIVVICCFVTTTPHINAVMRCVPDELRSLALGIESFFGRVLGIYLLLAGVVPKVIALVFLILAGRFYSPDTSSTDMHMDAVSGLPSTEESNISAPSLGSVPLHLPQRQPTAVSATDRQTIYDIQSLNTSHNIQSQYTTYI